MVRVEVTPIIVIRTDWVVKTMISYGVTVSSLTVKFLLRQLSLYLSVIMRSFTRI